MGFLNPCSTTKSLWTVRVTLKISNEWSGFRTFGRSGANDVYVSARRAVETACTVVRREVLTR